MTERHSMTRPGTEGARAAARANAERPAPGWPAVVLRVAGAGLLIATAAIHLDLYLTGYRTIPTIGWLFLLQVIAAFGLGLAVLAIPGRLAAAPAGGRGRSRLRPGHPRRLPAVGLDRAVRVQGGPHHAPASPPASSRWPPSRCWPRSRSLPPRRPAGGRSGPGPFPARIPPAAARAAGMTAAGLAVVALVLFGLAVAGASSDAPAASGHGPEDHARSAGPRC